MRLSLLLGGVLAASAAASVALAAPVSEVSVRVSPEIQAKSLKRTSNYDQRDLDYLTKTLQQQIERKVGVAPGGDRLEVTIVDLQNNRPTFKQMGEKPGLWPMSPSIGGAAVESVRISPDGARTPVNYKRYDIDILDSIRFGVTPWSTAQRTFDGYARKVAQN